MNARAVTHCRVLSNLKYSQLDIMAHNSFAIMSRYRALCLTNEIKPSFHLQ